jgi:hypothetical protein
MGSRVSNGVPAQESAPRGGREGRGEVEVRLFRRIVELWEDGPDVSLYAVASALARERADKGRHYADPGSARVLERMRQREEQLRFRRGKRA